MNKNNVDNNLTIGHSLFGQVIIDDQGVLSIITEVFTHGASRVWGQVLQWSSIGSSGRYDDGVSNGATVCQSLQDLCNSGSLLTDGNVDTV